MEKRQESTLTRSCVGDSVHIQDEVVLEENVADDGEEVDQDERQHSSQDNRAPVASHALDHVEQRLLSVDKVEKLRKERKRKSSSLPQSACYCCCGERSEVRRDRKGQTHALGWRFTVSLSFGFLLWRRKKLIQAVL